jgi:hypothetical protein
VVELIAACAIIEFILDLVVVTQIELQSVTLVGDDVDSLTTYAGLLVKFRGL